MTRGVRHLHGCKVERILVFLELLSSVRRLTPFLAALQSS